MAGPPGAKPSLATRWRSQLRGCVIQCSVAPARLRLRRICLGVGFHADAGADEVAIAVDVVDAADARPELARTREAIREGRGLARIGVVPRVGADDLRGV